MQEAGGQRGIGEIPTVFAIDGVVLEGVRGVLPEGQRLVLRVVTCVVAKGQEDLVVEVRTGRADRDEDRSLPLALCELHDLEDVTRDDTGLVDDREDVVQSLQRGRRRRQRLEGRVRQRHVQAVFVDVRAGDELLVELHHPASSVEGQTGLSLVDGDHHDVGTLPHVKSA